MKGRGPGGAAGLLALLAACASTEVPPLTRHVAAAREGVLRAGAAVVDVTPEGEVWMGGFGILRDSEGVHDPLYARALALERGGLELVLVAVDCVGLQRQDLQRLEGRLGGLDPRQLVVASTHDHAGPDTLGLWGLPPLFSGQDEAVMGRVLDGIVTAVARARIARRPAELAAGSMQLDAAGLMKNLRFPGRLDRELVVLHVRERGESRTIATWLELGCHPEVLDRHNDWISADFPAWTVAMLEAELGGVGIYTSGALGGLVTPDTEDRSFAGAQRLGRRLGRAALDVVKGLDGYDARPALAVIHQPVSIDQANFRYDLLRWTGILDRELHDGCLRSEVNLWTLGPLKVATIPGEITPDLGLEIKRLVGGSPTMILGLANDELGYLLPSAQFDGDEFAYERNLSPGPQAGDQVVDAFRRLVALPARE